MTTRRGVQDKAALGRRVKEILRKNPNASQRGIAKQLRQEGFRGSNDLIRGITRVLKAEGKALNRLLATRGISIQQLTTNLRSLLIAVGEGTLPLISVAVEWEATILVEFFVNNKSEGRREIKARGRIVQPLEAFSAKLLNERILVQLEGQASIEFTNAGNLKGQSYVEDLRMVIISTKYNKLVAYLRARR